MVPLIESIQKTWWSIANDGVVETGLKIFHRLGVLSVFHGFHFVVTELDPVSLEKNHPHAGRNRPEGPELEFGEITREDLERLDFAEGMYPRETLEMHFSKGIRFFAAFYRGKVVAVNGVHSKVANLVYIKMPNLILPEGVAYLNCCLTAPSWRNRSVGTQLRHFMLRQLLTEGIRSVLAAVFLNDKGALRWNCRNASQYLGRIYYLRCGNRDLWWRRMTRIGFQYCSLFNGISHAPSDALAEAA